MEVVLIPLVSISFLILTLSERPVEEYICVFVLNGVSKSSKIGFLVSFFIFF